MIQWHCKPFNKLTLRELYSILALRQEVFIVEQYCPYLDIDGKDFSCYHLLGMDKDNKLLAYSRLIPKGVSFPEEASIGRIVASNLTRGMGIGSELLKVSIEKMDELFGNTDIRIGAQCYLTGFYNKFGFEVDSEIYLEDNIPHVDMLIRKAVIDK